MQSIAGRSKRCLDGGYNLLPLLLGFPRPSFQSLFFLTTADTFPGPSLEHYSHDLFLARHINSGAAVVGDQFRS